MSEIPFVNLLGDSIEEAIRRPAPARRRMRLGRRRYLAVALAALAVTGGGAAVAELLTDPVEIGFGGVGCFERTEPEGNVAVVADPTRSPVELCISSLPQTYQGLTARDLIACSWEGHGVVVVIRGERGGCPARGLAPVPPSYAAARRRAARLEAQVKEFERAAGCIPPSEFARRLTRDLRAGGWRQWRAVVRGGEGPCGRVSVASGSALLGSIGPAVDARKRTVAVAAAFPLSVERIVFGAGSPGARLFDSSGERCFTVAGLERHVRVALAPAGLPIRFTVEPLGPNVGVTGARGDRYEEGCAIFAGASLAEVDGGMEILAELSRRG